MQRMRKTQYKFWFIWRILQYDVFITDKNYIFFLAVWFILITFYHVGRRWGNNS